LIEKRHGLDLSLEQIEGFEPQQTTSVAMPAGGGVKGRRPSRKDKLRLASGQAC